MSKKEITESVPNLTSDIILLDRWRVCDGVIFGRDVNNNNIPTQTGKIDLPKKMEEGDVLVNTLGTHFALGSPSLKVVHLMTQDDQPYGSERKCCERCGTAMWNFQYYFDNKRLYTKEIAESVGGIRCVDIND